MVGMRLMVFIDRMSLTSQGLAAVGAFLTMLTVGTIGFHYLERDWNWVEAFYFATYTLTTVGYGDYVPSNDASRLCASVYMIFGVTIALAALAVIGSNYMTRREDSIIKKYEEKRAKGKMVDEKDPIDARKPPVDGKGDEVDR
jgi:hypothetical protein